MNYSVALACFNGQEFILDQLSSIITSFSYAQIEDFEIIVSDDGSKDQTVDLVRSLNDKRIFILKGPKLGLIKNFENALRHCSGDIIFLSDQDDVWFESKVKNCLAILEDSDLVLSDAIVVDRNLLVLNNSFFNLNGSRPGAIKNLIKNSYLGCGLAFKRNVLNLALPFPKSIPMHDWWIGLIAESMYKVGYIYSPLFYYRRHGGNASVTSEKSQYPLSTKLKWRAKLLIALIFRLVHFFVINLKAVFNK